MHQEPHPILIKTLIDKTQLSSRREREQKQARELHAIPQVVSADTAQEDSNTSAHSLRKGSALEKEQQATLAALKEPAVHAWDSVSLGNADDRLTLGGDTQQV